MGGGLFTSGRACSSQLFPSPPSSSRSSSLPSFSSLSSSSFAPSSLPPSFFSHQSSRLSGIFSSPFSLYSFLLFSGALLTIIALLSLPASAVSIGVNKGAINYQNVLQNGYAEERFLVTTDADATITGSYQFEGDIASWLRMEPPTQNFTFSKNAPYQLTLIVEPPADAQLMNYSGGVRVLTGEVLRTEGGKIGTSTRAAFFIRLGVGLTGTQILKCNVGGLQIKDSEINQPLDFLATIHNTGNVRITPEFIILVYNQDQTLLLKNLTFISKDAILPTRTEQILRQLENTLDVGQYWARIEVPTCGDAGFLTFDVLERGGIADKGELLSLEVKPRAKTGEIIPIAAVFKNTGPRTVSAKFKGTVTTMDGKVVKVIDTDFYDVPSGLTARLETFFNPTEPARYLITGRVLYNNKLTFQRSTSVLVEGPQMVGVTQISWLIIVLLLFVLLLLLFLIRRRRQRRIVVRR